MNDLRLSAGTGLLVTAAFFSGLVSAAPVTTSSTTFDDFNVGTVANQGAWTKTGGYFEQVVDLGGGNKAWQISNRTTAGSFADMPYAPKSGVFAGESSTGAAYSRFIGSFKFRSVSDVVDPGARITISADDGSGGRQGMLALRSDAAGVAIDAFGYQSPAFTQPTLATVNFAEWNAIRYEIDFYDGIENDVISFYLNDALIGTTESWEQYYIDDAGQAAIHPNGVDVQTFLFRLSGTAAANSQGFYIDDVVTQVDNRAAVPEPASLALVGAALGGLAFMRRRRTR